MNATPLIAREMVAAVHKKKLARQRFWFAALGCGLVAVVLLVSFLGSGVSGRDVNRWLFILGLYVTVSSTSLMTADLFTREELEGTVGLLFLSGLNALDFFIGKMLGAFLVALNSLFALVPVLAIPFFLGGVSKELFLATIACLPAILCFSLAVSILSSVVRGGDGFAFVIRMVLVGLVCGLTPVLHLGDRLFGGGTFTRGWLLLSPAYAPYQIFNDLPGGGFGVWTNLGVTMAWSLAFLLVAMRLLHWRWDRQVRCEEPSAWRSRWHGWRRGDDRWRSQLRKHWLEADPFLWLTLQDRQPALMGWLAIAGIAVLWLLGWWAWPGTWPGVMNFFITAVLLNFILAKLMEHAASKRIATDRRSGAMELLLTTSMPVSSIVYGQTRGVEIQFRPHLRLAVALCLLMMMAGFPTRTWNGWSPVVYLIVWSWILHAFLRQRTRHLLNPMWISLNTGLPGFAIWHGARWQYFWLIWLAYNLSRSGPLSVRFPTGSLTELVWVLCLSGGVLLIMRVSDKWWDHHPREKLFGEFRAIAQDPVPEPNDPRLKKWDMKERLPSPLPQQSRLVDRTLRRVDVKRQARQLREQREARIKSEQG